MKTQSLIKEFLSQKRFAVVGISRDPDKFSRRLFRELLRHGYDVAPVNPNARELDGKRCYARIQEIQPPITSALLLTSWEKADQILLDCADAGVTLVWIYGISGAKDIGSSALALCQKHGIEIVPGYCPYMFMPMTAVYHRLHGFVSRAIGAYPK